MPRAASTPSTTRTSEGHLFGTSVWETLGAVNSEGESYFMRFASVRQNHEHSSYCGRMWARLSCCIQREVAKQLIQRTAGQKYHDKLPMNASAEDVAARVKARVEIDN